MNKQYTVGVGEVPNWLKEQAAKGRFKFLYDEQHDLIGGTIYSPTGAIVVGLTDTIVFGNSGMYVVKKKEKPYVKKEKAEYKGIQ